ncbi:MAG: outer membrane protein assembly factor BamA [Qingshengfaniella sp.]
MQRRTGLGRSLVFGSALLLAQGGSAALAQQSFSTIQVQGNQRIETSTILTYAGLVPGEGVTAGQVNAAYQRIQDSGLFETVEIDAQGRTLVIQVTEYPTINQISIEGNRRINDETLLALLTSQPRRVYSPTAAEADTKLIADTYRQAGRLAATVDPKIIPRSQNRVDLVFEVTEGDVIEVERIGFVGNRSFSDRRLRQVLGTKQAGLFRALIRSDTLIEDRIQFDRQMLTDFYRSRGFIDFRILSVTPEFSRERDAFFLTFNIEEGQRYKIGEVSVSSDVPGVDVDLFRAVMRLRQGQTYSPTRIEDSVARLERKSLIEGMDFIRAEPRITRNDRDLTLDVDFALIRGPRIFVERIDIEGNATTQDQVIRRQFDVVEGDPFNPREIRQSAERIRALGYFTDVQVDAREGTQPDRVIVDVNVEEQPTGSLSLGVNYSMNDGFGFAFGLDERNFLGRGQILNFMLGFGVDNVNSNISLTDPSLFGRDLGGSFEVFYRTSDNFSADFDTLEYGASPSISFPVSDNGRLRLRYELSSAEISNVDDGGNRSSNSNNGSSVILQREEGERITSEIGYTYTYDTRRTGLNPNAGVKLEFGQDLAGLGGDNKFIRTSALVGAETRVLNEDVRLSAIFQGGALVMLEDDSWVLDRYRSGGRLRGFRRNGIGPRDRTASNKDALGGNYMASFSLEADFPLGLPEEYGMRGGVFFDAGSIWGLDDTDGTSGSVDDDFHLRTVVGASLFWDTPIGPLRFNFTRALESKSYDKERNFDLTVSTRF